MTAKHTIGTREKALSTTILALLLSIGASAADDKTLTVMNGQQTEQDVSRITFGETDMLTLHFADGHTEDVDMARVSIVFTHDTAIRLPESPSAKPAATYFDLQGRKLMCQPEHGPYIVKRGDNVIKVMGR